MNGPHRDPRDALIEHLEAENAELKSKLEEKERPVRVEPKEMPWPVSRLPSYKTRAGRSLAYLTLPVTSLIMTLGMAVGGFGWGKCLAFRYIWWVFLGCACLEQWGTVSTGWIIRALYLTSLSLFNAFAGAMLLCCPETNPICREFWEGPKREPSQEEEKTMIEQGTKESKQ